MKPTTLWLGLIFASLVGPADARADSAGLYKMCTASKGTLEDMFCTGYMAGFVHGFTLGDAQFDANDKRRAVCLPKGGTSAPELRTLVVQHLKDNPQDLKREPADVTLRALMLAHPCSPSN